ncbi:short-chain dehydrogenase [Paenibacillus swuensis]|uniref:Short-chain dehydrogenase n=1 Tax=Paenibacillus swuensis TaxID=1178515 RepID=A0A172THW0_9BACL|nr:SDR family oxidoreductase [Paenibacillus swuensis]ANE46546.1 short-chain dehydrogenase [Paenibacillus swuensis]
MQEKRKIAVVTGASGGMGRATAGLLAAEHGMKVFLVARSADKGQAAVDDVNRLSGRDDAELLVCDLASFASIRAAAAELSSRCERIDVLINNAGVVTLRREETEDGFERQLGVNHLGHFLFTGLLFPLLKRSPAGRLVIISSGAHKIGRMNYGDPGMNKSYTVWNAYGRSKIANLWFMKELAGRLSGTSVTVNAVHPGAVATQLGVDRRTGFGAMVHKLLRPFFQTPELGSATAVYVATSPEVAGKSGLYWYKMRPEPVSNLAESAEEAKRFWAWSEEATGFRWDA